MEVQYTGVILEYKDIVVLLDLVDRLILELLDRRDIVDQQVL